MASFLRSIPSDVWLGCILPHLETRDVLSLVGTNSELRSFFTFGRLAVVLKEMGFSEYLSPNEWLRYLGSLGAFLEDLEIDTRTFKLRMDPDVNFHGLLKLLAPLKDQTSETVTESLHVLAGLSRCSVCRLKLFSPFLAGIGRKEFKVFTHHSSFYNHMDEPKQIDERDAKGLFVPSRPWNELLWPTLTELRLVGFYGDAGPTFAPKSLQQLGAAVPNLTLLEMQCFPVAIDFEEWFPRLETFIAVHSARRQFEIVLEEFCVKGSPSLRSLELLGTPACHVSRLIQTCPNLLSLDMGRRTVGEALVATLPHSLIRLVTNGFGIKCIALQHRLEWLEVFNCHVASQENLQSLAQQSQSVTLHRVPCAYSFGGSVTVFSVPPSTPEPEPRPGHGAPFLNYAPIPEPEVDHSRVSGGVLNKTAHCPACTVLIDPSCVADHDIVCSRRKHACVCGVTVETLRELDKHKKRCKLFVKMCQCCGKEVHCTDFSGHYSREHADRDSVIRNADCPNRTGGCLFFGAAQNSAERERHIRFCRSGVYKCMACGDDVACLAARSVHDCKGARFVVAMGMLAAPCLPLFPEDKSRPAGIPIEGEDACSWECGHCHHKNLVRKDTRYYARWHCVNCHRAVLRNYEESQKRK